MKARPLPLLLLALFQICSPLATLFFNAWALDVKASYVLTWMFQGSTLRIFETVFLMPIAGVAIYLMKPWSYAVFLGAMGWSLVSNLMAWHYAHDAKISLPMIILLYGAQIGLAVYFMLPSVRRAYLDPTVRWWEAQKRILYQVPFTGQHAGKPLKGQIMNLSAGGALLSSLNHEFKRGDTLILRFEVAGIAFETPAESVYLSSAGTGVRFTMTPESELRFKRLVKGLELIGVPFRDQEVASLRSRAVSWVLRLLRTGRGLTPEMEATQRKSQS